MKALGEHEQEAVRGILDGLERDVELLLELGPEEVPVTVVAGGREIDFGAETAVLLEQVASLSDRVELTVTETSEDAGAGRRRPSAGEPRLSRAAVGATS